MVAASSASPSQREIVVRNTFVHVHEKDIDANDDEIHSRPEKRRAKTQPALICSFAVQIECSDSEDSYDTEEDDHADEESCNSPMMTSVKTHDPFEQSPFSSSGAMQPTVLQMPMLCFGMGVPLTPVRTQEHMEGDKIQASESERQHLPATTVILRNLPLNYKRAMVQKMIDGEGFAGKYNFLYRPADFQTGTGLGYVFVNLSSSNYVAEFWKVFDGYNKWVFRSSKVCSVSWSTDDQGLAAHIERFRNAQIMHESVPDEYKPVVFKRGMRVAFPSPTQHIEPPTCTIAVKSAKRPKRQRGNRQAC